ncbi:MAG: phosphoenolpyruvate-utilizing N-terminal domain-containing protein, partial [Oscillospiraceae bacterium]
MVVIDGKSIFEGIAMGKLVIYRHKEKPVKRYRVNDAKIELVRFKDAKEVAFYQLQSIFDTSTIEIGKLNAEIFASHQMMLKDE